MKKLGIFFLIFYFSFLCAMEPDRKKNIGLKRKQLSSHDFDKSEDDRPTGDNQLQSQGLKDRQVAAALQRNIKNEIELATYFAAINLELFEMQRKSKVPYDDLAMNLYIASKYVSDLNNILIHLNPKTLVEFNVQKLRLKKMTLQTKVETGIFYALQNTKTKYQEGFALEAREFMKKIDDIVELLGKNIKPLTTRAIESTKKELELK